MDFNHLVGDKTVRKKSGSDLSFFILKQTEKFDFLQGHFRSCSWYCQLPLKISQVAELRLTTHNH